MEDGQLLTVMATPIRIPAVVERTRWPVHVTIAGNFRVNEANTIEVSALLDSVATNVAAFVVKLGPKESFGPERNIPVLLALHPEFQRLHESLTERLREMQGFAAAEPSFWEGGYRPHATLGAVVDVREGDDLSLRTLTLVSLHGNIGKRIYDVELF
jgi:2'-5' RNA ligase